MTVMILQERNSSNSYSRLLWLCHPFTIICPFSSSSTIRLYSMFNFILPHLFYYFPVLSSSLYFRYWI